MTHALEVFRCTVPRVSAPTTPHGGGLETHQARMIDQRDSRVHGLVDGECGLGKRQKVTMSIVEGASLLFTDEERRYHSGNQREIFIYVVSLRHAGQRNLVRSGR